VFGLGKLTTIAVSEETYNTLRELGRTGDSFDRVLRRVLKIDKRLRKAQHVNKLSETQT